MEKLTIIKTLAELQALTPRLQEAEYISFDIETTGLTFEDRTIGFSIAIDVEEAYYVILHAWDKAAESLITLETQPGAKAFLEALQAHKLIMHNGVFDCSMIENEYGVSLMPSLHTDTMILAHLLNENRRVGLKELAVSIFGETSTKEQAEMKASIQANGGQITKTCYELYKGDADLIALYGAKDALLTLKLFYELVPELYEQGLDKFFYDEESMPLLRGPTYQLNTVGLKIDTDRLRQLKGEIEVFCHEAKAFIYKEIEPLVKDKYPGTSKAKTFNVGAGQQLSWLLFSKMGLQFDKLTGEGRVIAKYLGFERLPYSYKDKNEFFKLCREAKGREYGKQPSGRPKTIGDYWKYFKCDKEVLKKIAPGYPWVQKYLEYSKNLKVLNTYVLGIQEKTSYGIIRPSFLQHGTTSGRYASRSPNFQNLPRGDKRIKECIISRPGHVFVGADQSQLEPRVFASFSGDCRLLECFRSGDDFYSVIGAPVFGKEDCSLVKDVPGSFSVKYPKLRDIAKIIALSLTYGTTPGKLAMALGCSMDEAVEISNNYFENFPDVKRLMNDSHKMALTEGQVVNLFGRPRRMPEAKNFSKIFGRTPVERWPYEARNLLNLAVNHRIQSTGASIINRAAIAFHVGAEKRGWRGVNLVLNVHDELVYECPQAMAPAVAELLKHCMENTVVLPGVALKADPKIGGNLAEIK